MAKRMRALPFVIVLASCGPRPAALPPPPSQATPSRPTPALQSPAPGATLAVDAAPLPIQSIASVPQCEAFDWKPRALPPLLGAGKAARPEHADRAAAELGAFESECEDAPDGPSERSPRSAVIDGVRLGLEMTVPAGSSGRGWTGNQCSFSARLADGSGAVVRLGAAEIPPFNTIRAVVRAGSAVFLSVSFNGYTKEFPRGGNRVIALDLCEGRVVWQTPNATSNGGLLLLGDYLISPFGFTGERRFLFVLDARSGAVVQKLPVVESVCPSERWAPNWQPGQRCDPPGQNVGAASNPHVARGLVLVDTNTGSAAFQFE